MASAGDWYRMLHDIDTGLTPGARILVVSPHLDDAVFGCGDLIADHPDATVVTIFAGGPAEWVAPTSWDARAGFRAGQDVMHQRRAEDDCALRLLGATPVWLPFWDSQYGRPPLPEAIAAALYRVVSERHPDAVFVPLGLWHSDHRLAHQSALRLTTSDLPVAWFVYADAIYRTFSDSGLEEQAGCLPLRNPVVSPFRASPRKRAAIASYRSQLIALTEPGSPGWTDALEPEQFWRLEAGVGQA